MNIEPTGAYRQPPQGFFAKLWGFSIFVVVALVACVSKTYWAANNAVVASRFQDQDVEMVVLEGMVQVTLGELELEESLGKTSSCELFRVKPVSQSIRAPQYMWVYDAHHYQPLYGVFPSLEAAEVWATDNGFEFNADSFAFVRSSERGILVTPPIAPKLDVHIFTHYYAVMDEGSYPLYAQPREDYSQVAAVYAQLRR